MCVHSCVRVWIVCVHGYVSVTWRGNACVHGCVCTWVLYVCACLEWSCLTHIFALYKTFMLLLFIIVETVNVTNFAGVCSAEGYGDDRQDTLEAFPFSQQLPKANEEDAEFLQKLRHMGKGW